MKQVSFWGPTNISRQHIKFRRSEFAHRWFIIYWEFQRDFTVFSFWMRPLDVTNVGCIPPVLKWHQNIISIIIDRTFGLRFSGRCLWSLITASRNVASCGLLDGCSSLEEPTVPMYSVENREKGVLLGTSGCTRRGQNATVLCCPQNDMWYDKNDSSSLCWESPDRHPRNSENLQVSNLRVHILH